MQKNKKVKKVPAQAGGQADSHHVGSCAASPDTANGLAIDPRYHSCLNKLHGRLWKRGVSPVDLAHVAADILNSVLKKTPFDHPQFPSRLARRARDRAVSARKGGWRRRTEPLKEEMSDPVLTESPDQGVEDLIEEVRAAVRRLLARQQLLLHLRFELGYTLKEIVALAAQSLPTLPDLAPAEGAKAAQGRLLPASLSGIKSLSARTLNQLRSMLAHLRP
jgi:DNA-directed RNA polymerase specialized sigma24 family protein